MWWCHATRVGDLSWDIQLADADGSVLVDMAGFELRKASRSALRRRQLADLLYQVEWHPRSLPPGAGTCTGDWLIVGGGGESLAERLRESGHPCTLAAEYFESPWAGVIFVCGSDRDDSTDVPARAESLASELLRLLQTAERLPECPPIWLVTTNAQAVRAGDTLNVSQAPLWGMARTLFLEAPNLVLHCVDMDDAANLDALVAELISTAAAGETQVAYRGGQRSVARLARYRDALKGADRRTGAPAVSRLWQPRPAPCGAA
jgi:hypothetical protein